MNLALLRRAAVACLVLAAPAMADGKDTFDTGMIPSPRILLPEADETGAVVLISDAGGWSEREDGLAARLKDEGAVVIGIDLPAYLAALAKDKGDCIYMVSDIESLSQQVQRAHGNESYHLPIVAGVGAGGALALAIAAQTPAATIGHTLSADPEAGIALPLQLCTPAAKERAGERMVYGLTDGPLPDPVTVLQSDAAPEDGKAHVDRLLAAHPDIEVTAVDGDSWTEFSDALSDLVAAGHDDDNPLGLPLTVLDTKPTRDTMAVIYSGDGGWRDIDKQVGDVLQQQGMPVVGIDSLRYFWSEREPQAVAQDLSRIITLYEKRWNVKRVLLIGYSFGADVLPRTFTLLPKGDQDKVAQMSLLATSHQVDYKISVLGWIGASGSDGAGDPLDDVAKITPSLVQCIYGIDDKDDDACPAMAGRGIEAIETTGGHHFDGDYPALAKRILDGLDRRLAASK
ncbi:virulence factor family protein [Ensifer soli]|uniref:virulence factor family protein n=1 Tax=Ciceribacter sp. sgz301302 TaxID=3342379 RepID=UPI0035BA43E4